MAPTALHRTALLMLLVVTVVGAVDAAIGGVWDHFVVFVLGSAVGAALLLTSVGRRPLVPLRADLVAWLRARASATGEPMEAIADRCIAEARADLDVR
jgi:hypothetical protein